MNAESAEVLALSALGHIANNTMLLDRFVAISGSSADDIRSGAADPAFLAGVLDFLLSDETALLAFCQTSNIDPEIPGRARAFLPGAPMDW